MMWWWADKTTAGLVAGSCALNSLRIPVQHTILMTLANAAFVLLFLCARKAARRNCLAAHMILHAMWHYLPPLFYAIYIRFVYSAG